MDFSSSINPLGMPPGVRQAFLDSADSCQRYPDPHCVALREQLAEHHGVPLEAVMAGNGAADLIYRVALGLRPQSALIPCPTFSEYRRALGLAGCAIRLYAMERGDGFCLDDAFLGEIRGGDAVFLCNPNNPTGGLYPRAFLLKALGRCEEVGAVLVLDECFLDFVEDGEGESLMGRVAGTKHLILLRAFTKLYALPGLRLGYAVVANPRHYRAMEGAAAPWSVSAPAQRCGVAALGEGDFVEATRRLVACQRQYLAAGLAGLGIQVFPSRANFLLFSTETPDLQGNLARRGFLIRDCSNFPGLRPGDYRAAVRLEDENRALIKAIKELNAWQVS